MAQVNDPPEILPDETVVHTEEEDGILVQRLQLRVRGGGGLVMDQTTWRWMMEVDHSQGRDVYILWLHNPIRDVYMPCTLLDTVIP